MEEEEVQSQDSSDGSENYNEDNEQEEYEQEEEPSEEQEEEAPAEQPRATIPALNIPGLTAEERERLNELAITDPVAAFEIVSQRQLAARDQQEAITGYFYAEAEKAAPEFFNAYRMELRQGLANCPAAMKGTKDAVNYAKVYALGIRAHNTGGDLDKVILDAADKIRGKKAQQAAPQQTIRPSQRTTTPTVSGGRGGGAPAPRNTDRRAWALAQIGLDATEIKSVSTALSNRRGGN